MTRNILVRRVGSVVVLRQNKNDALDSEWDDFLGYLTANRADLPLMRMLVRTDGGVPNASHRKRLQATLGDMHPLVACVSDAMKVRFAGSTIALFQKNYRQYTVRELTEAFEYLGVTLPADQRRIQAALLEMEAGLSA